MCARGSQHGSQEEQKGPFRIWQGASDLARSEGLEPPTF
jgi:hypothetical protein